jgi:hypothetical protein
VNPPAAEKGGKTMFGLVRKRCNLFDYSSIDTQIAKFRKLANEYKESNRAYYGEYLSHILFDD